MLMAVVDRARVRRAWTYQQLRVRTERGVPLDIMFLLLSVVGMEKGGRKKGRKRSRKVKAKRKGKGWSSDEVCDGVDEDEGLMRSTKSVKKKKEEVSAKKFNLKWAKRDFIFPQVSDRGEKVTATQLPVPQTSFLAPPSSLPSLLSQLQPSSSMATTPPSSSTTLPDAAGQVPASTPRSPSANFRFPALQPEAVFPT